MDDRKDLFIGGVWQPPATANRIDVVSPSTEQVIASVPEASPEDVDAAVVAARRAFDAGPWPRLEPAERVAALRRLAAAITERADAFAAVSTAEAGAPVALARRLVSAPLGLLDYYATLAETYPFVERRRRYSATALGASAGEAPDASLVVREPVGVVAAVVPWNGPLFITMLKMAPALLAGCTFVLKPPPETPLFGYLLAEAVEAAGIPEGVVSILAGGREVGAHLVAHPGVDKISLTGSGGSGKAVMAAASARLARVTLELGGKSAAIVLEDADVASLGMALAYPTVMNSGQACAAYTRVLAPRSRYDEVVDALRETIGAMTVGDPTAATTQLGPLISAAQRERVERYIAIGRQEGAQVALGGGRPAELPVGWYVEPTIFVGVDNTMTIAREEIFGPVVSVLPFDSEDEAVAIGNDSDFGLAGGVYTADARRGFDVCRRLRAGQTTVNGFALDLATPFGGFKQSGFGREGGPEGLAEYLEPKTINVPAGFEL